MLYAKIDAEGNVISFPYIVDRLSEIPADAVEVDTQTLKPAASWNEKLMYNEIIRDNDTYTLSYTAETKFSLLEDKQNWLLKAIEMKKKENDKIFKSKVAQLKTGYFDDEILSWDTQVKEAEAYIADNTATVPLIQIMATNREITVLELANRIIQKRSDFTNSYGAILGKYQKNTDILESIDLEDETTFDNIDLYGWNL